MTLRERIADWISGGELSFARRQMQDFEKLAGDWCKLARAESELRRGGDDRLARIAAQETPGANATVRRMARIARGEE